MKDQTWDLNQTWPVGRNFGSGVDLQMLHKISGPSPTNLGRKKQHHKHRQLCQAAAKPAAWPATTHF